jgi:hypothetical protein
MFADEVGNDPLAMTTYSIESNVPTRYYDLDHLEAEYWESA